MTREELVTVADCVIANWNLSLGGDRRKAFYKMWWRYLGDLNYTEVQSAIDALVLADKPFAPRVGTVRRMVLAEFDYDLAPRETFPFDATTLVFKVGPAEAGKMYALTDVQADPVTVSVKVRPDRGEELRAAFDAITPGYHLNKRHWVTVPLDGRVPPALIRELITGSHALVVAGMTRAQRQALGL